MVCVEVEDYCRTRVMSVCGGRGLLPERGNECVWRESRTIAGTGNECVWRTIAGTGNECVWRSRTIAGTGNECVWRSRTIAGTGNECVWRSRTIAGTGNECVWRSRTIAGNGFMSVCGGRGLLPERVMSVWGGRGTIAERVIEWCVEVEDYCRNGLRRCVWRSRTIAGAGNECVWRSRNAERVMSVCGGRGLCRNGGNECVWRSRDYCRNGYSVEDCFAGTGNVCVCVEVEDCFAGTGNVCVCGGRGLFSRETGLFAGTGNVVCVWRSRTVLPERVMCVCVEVEDCFAGAMNEFVCLEVEDCILQAWAISVWRFFIIHAMFLWAMMQLMLCLRTDPFSRSRPSTVDSRWRDGRESLSFNTLFSTVSKPGSRYFSIKNNEDETTNVNLQDTIEFFLNHQ
ncbi:hypothetical protein HNY73_022861 [Argiope bruennichi]|uniref:Uncharacterized protein n=1 Tax=Argiope bruennichi TaxID=94029 RepID=A0A8T0E3Q5_ARGBR|nr:hypothetical protein HNY73_022861 [Argiope bruennichi]